METLQRDDVRLHIVADALRRRFVLIVVVVALVTTAIGAYVMHLAPSYAASAKVLIRPIPGNALSLDSSKNGQQVTVAMETEAGLVNSPKVAALVSKALHATVTAGSPAVSATVPPNTQIVEIRYTAHSAKAAQEGAQAYADAFLVFRAGEANDNLQHQLEVLAKQAKSAGESLKKSSAAAASANPPSDAAAQVQLYTNRLASLQEAIGQLQAQATDAGSVVTPATAPASPTGLNPLFLIIGAAICGMFGGVGLAIWRERNDDRVRSASETSVAGVPFLAHVPQPSSGRALIGDQDGDPVWANAYRRARAALTVCAPRPAVLAVSAVNDLGRPGASAEVALNLALSLVAAEHTVCLVDATWDSSAMSDMLDVGGQRGLSEVLLHEGIETLPLLERGGLSVLPAGGAPARARELYASPHFSSMIDGLRGRYDYVLLASPSASTPDGDEIALAADGVVMVLADRLTSHKQVSDAVARARQLEVSVLGLISIARPGRTDRKAGLAKRHQQVPLEVPAVGPSDQMAPEAVSPRSVS